MTFDIYVIVIKTVSFKVPYNVVGYPPRKPTGHHVPRSLSRFGFLRRIGAIRNLQ